MSFSFIIAFAHSILNFNNGDVQLMGKHDRIYNDAEFVHNLIIVMQLHA